MGQGSGEPRILACSIVTGAPADRRTRQTRWSNVAGHRSVCRVCGCVCVCVCRAFCPTKRERVENGVRSDARELARTPRPCSARGRKSTTAATRLSRRCTVAPAARGRAAVTTAVQGATRCSVATQPERCRHGRKARRGNHDQGTTKLPSRPGTGGSRVCQVGAGPCAACLCARARCTHLPSTGARVLLTVRTPTPSLALCSFVALFLDQRGRWSCLRTPSMHVAQLCTYKARCTRGCVPVDPHARWRVVACMHAASAPAMQCVRKANTSTTVMTRWSVAATDRCRTHVTARHCQPAHDHARLGPSQ